MEYFYIIVLTVAIICLILTLTVIGIILSSQTNAAVFPPTKNSCPDYWSFYSTDETGNVTCNIPTSNINKGSQKDGTPIDYSKLPGGSSTTINFGHPDWASTYNTTNQCALKLWSNQNNISWDGVSNYNGCK